jgi:hypothetical protein
MGDDILKLATLDMDYSFYMKLSISLEGQKHFSFGQIKYLSLARKKANIMFLD